MSIKARRFWPLLSLLVVTDCTTKRLAETHLVPAHVPHEVIGEYVQFTLAHNPGAAFSISVGPMSRVVFTILGLIVLGVLWALYRQTENHDRWQSVALALVAGGALGNLLDRIRSAKGVVDFIDIGFGDYRFWTFNFADVGVTAGDCCSPSCCCAAPRRIPCPRRRRPRSPYELVRTRPHAERLFAGAA